jgi:hypothetical protein
MFTTVNNAAINLRGTISTSLLKIWNVCASQFKHSPPIIDGMWRLSLLTTVLQTSAVLLIPLLPHRKEDLNTWISKTRTGLEAPYLSSC